MPYTIDYSTTTSCYCLKDIFIHGQKELRVEPLRAQLHYHPVIIC